MRGVRVRGLDIPVGGLVTGFFIATLVGIPSALRTSWALTDQAPDGVHYTCDAKGRSFYNGPARYPLEWGLPP